MRLGVRSLPPLLLLLAVVLDGARANLDLYLNLFEVKRLLGLSAELYYVREGQVNDYALNYTVPVPANINELHFTWQSLAGRPLPYAIDIEVSNRAVIAAAPLNITRIGAVPVTPQTFRIKLPCSGHLAAEVDVSVFINITLNKSNNNVTHLIFRRKKICLEEDVYRKIQGATHISIDNAPSETTSANIFYIAVGCALALIAFITLPVATCYVRNNKARRQGEMLQESRNCSRSSAQAHTTFLSVDTAIPHTAFTGTSGSSCKSGGSYASFRRMPSCSVVDERSKDLHERIAELTIQRCRVRLRSVVLEGAFGRVYKGTYTEEDSREQDVLVKTVTEHASQIQVSLLLQEGMAMYGLSHRHVLSVLGVSIEDHTSPFLIYPHSGYTNMKKFLQKCKVSSEGVAHTLTTQEVVDMALQVAQGLLYLHKKLMVHKDIAARNCVVDDKLRVQITDNALSRDLFPSDYHCLGDNENRPVKWLAVEALQRRAFTPASDGWSFGVLLWELTTLAQQPYQEIDPFEMGAYLRDGYRLAQPINCPDELFSVMAYCWAMSPDERPTIPQLQIFLQDFYTQLTRYV